MSRPLAILVALALALLLAVPAQAQDPCDEPGNLTFNCQFDSFSDAPGGQVPSGWWPFVLSGRPAFDQSSDTPKPPSLRIWSDGEGFTAGIYQEVSGLQPGATYRARIGWAAYASNGAIIGRIIGVDPYGGTDPTSPAIVWSPEVWEQKRINPELVVSAVAAGERMTVFVRVTNNRSSGADQAFLDAVGLVRDDSAAVVEPVTPEPTATEAATPAPEPTATPAVQEPALPLSTATDVAPTDTPALATAEPTPEPDQPSATPVPSATPSPTFTPTPRPSPVVWVLASPAPTLEPTRATLATPVLETRRGDMPAAVLVAGGIAIVMGGALALGSMAPRRRER